MPADTTDEDAYLESVASICDEMAALFIEGGLPPFAADPADSAIWAKDRVALETDLGSAVPTAWVIRTISTYLAESAYQLRSVAALLRSRLIVASIGPLVRSITERVGVTAWMLDPDVDALERAWRTMLNTLVCYSEYRRAVERLGADPEIQALLEEAHLSLRTDTLNWFSPTVGRRDPERERDWRRGVSGYPTYTDLAVRSLPSSGPADPFGEMQRKGLYSAQCGMTHPNVIVSGETLDFSDEGHMRFLHLWEHIDKELRVGFHSLSWGYRAWAWYFCKEGDMDTVMETLRHLSERLDACDVPGD